MQCAGPEGAFAGATECSAPERCTDADKTYWSTVQHVVAGYAPPSALVLVQAQHACGLRNDAGVDFDLCACRPGFYLDAQRSECLQCLQPNSTSSYNASICIPCASGHIWRQKQACQMCEQGKIASRNTLQCELCPAGKTTTRAGENACVCGPGYYNKQGECELCPVGKFKTWIGDDEALCTDCRGLEIPNPDKTACEICPRNQEASDRHDVCVCSAGFLTDPESRCIACDPGFFGPVKNGTDCLACPRGKFMPDYGAAICRDCNITEYDVQNQSTSCIPCPVVNMVRSLETADCECNAGFYQTLTPDLACLPCAQGTYKSISGSQACETCHHNTEGKVQYPVVTARTTCGQCLDGTEKDVLDFSGEACKTCNFDDFVQTDFEQQKCDYCTNGATGLNLTTGPSDVRL